MMSDSATLIGIAALCVLAFLGAARTLGEVTFLLSLLLIGGGYMALLGNAFFGLDTLMIAGGATLAGIAVSRLSAAGDIPTVRWRAAGLHATLMAATFTALAGVTIVTMPLTPGDAYKVAGGVYALLAGWHWIIALRMAARVMREG